MNGAETGQEVGASAAGATAPVARRRRFSARRDHHMARRALRLLCLLAFCASSAADAPWPEQRPLAANADASSDSRPAAGKNDAEGEDAPAKSEATPPESEATPPEGDDLDAIIADILSRPANEAEGAATTKQCIARLRIDRTEVLNERFIVFHMRAGKKYLVQFRNRCPGLRRRGVIELESRSFQVCAMDSVRGRYGVGIGGMWGPRCLIPGFEPVTEAQIEFIEEALRDGGPS